SLYEIGDQVFSQGAGAESGDLEAAKTRFAERFCEECRAADGDDLFLYVVSGLASQITMAHLSAVCFSGPDSYALPGGFTKASFRVARFGKAVHLTVARSAEGFTSFSLPDGEVHECHASSFLRQSAELELRPSPRRTDKPNAQLVAVDVLKVQEAIQVAWPDQRAVVHDGLELKFTSPPAGEEGICDKAVQLHQVVLLPVRLWLSLATSLRNMLCPKRKTA
ncbi:unnamed protein product, partial [Polarella glacialis]